MQRQIKCKRLFTYVQASVEREAKSFWNENYSGCEQSFVLPIWLFFCFVFRLRFDKSPRRFLQFLTLYAWSAFISLLLLWRLNNKKKKRSEQQVKCQAWQVCDFILPLVPSNLRKQRRIITCKRCATKWALILLALLLRHILQST